MNASITRIKDEDREGKRGGRREWHVGKNVINFKFHGKLSDCIKLLKISHFLPLGLSILRETKHSVKCSTTDTSHDGLWWP